MSVVGPWRWTLGPAPGESAQPEVCQTIRAHSGTGTSVQFTGDSKTLLTSSLDGLCRLWNVESGACLTTVIGDVNPAVSFARFSPND